MHRTYVGAVERGERNLTLATVERYAERIGVTPLDLLTEQSPRRDAQTPTHLTDTTKTRNNRTHEVIPVLRRGRELSDGFSETNRLGNHPKAPRHSLLLALPAALQRRRDTELCFASSINSSLVAAHKMLGTPLPEACCLTGAMRVSTLVNPCPAAFPRPTGRSCPMASSTVDGEAWSPYDDHHPDLAMPPRLDACPPRGSRPSTGQSTARRPSPYRPPGDGDLTRQHTQHDPDLGLRTEHRWSPRDTSSCPQTPSLASTTSPPESLTRETSPSNQTPSSPRGKRPKPA